MLARCKTAGKLLWQSRSASTRTFSSGSLNDYEQTQHIEAADSADFRHFSLPGSANGFGLPDQDAFATARGEAFVATADNASAIYYNPAGITQLTSSNLRGGIYGIYLEPELSVLPTARPTRPDLLQFRQFRRHSAILLHLHGQRCAVEFWSGRLCALWRQHELAAGHGFPLGRHGGSLKYITINPVMALKILPIAFHRRRRDGELCEDWTCSKACAPPQTPLTNFFKFSGDGWSVGYNVGVLWQPYQKISFGATFRSSANMNFRATPILNCNQRPYPHTRAPKCGGQI